MESRIELHEILVNVLGSRNVYYQPPASIQMKYPAIVYKRGRIANRPANDSVYKQEHSYTLTVIDPDPDSEIVERVALLPYCQHNQHFVSDNLNHDVFTIYYK